LEKLKQNLQQDEEYYWIFGDIGVDDPASFSYKQQDQLPGISVRDNTGRQSPINIDTRKVKKRKLAPLKFISAFFRNVEGDFENTCQNVEFTPTMPSSKLLLENTSYFSFIFTGEEELVKELSTWSTGMLKNLRFTLFL
jgi:hypothetical protein